jgi:hypothetical protein
MLLTSCHALRDQFDTSTTVDVSGVQPSLEQLNIRSDNQAQADLVSDLVTKAGLPTMPPLNDSNWSAVAEAGFYEVGRQCDQYMTLLFRFNRNQRALRQGLTAVGAATATILGLASVAAAPIAITAAAFGLSASLFDAGVNSVLFTVEPSALRTIVLKGRKSYIDSLDMTKITSRPRMLMAVQGYLLQCSPAAIEANVNNAANGLDSVSSADEKASRRAATLGVPAMILTQPASP